MVQTMRTAVAAGDVESFRRNAHSLKSNAYTFGANELGLLARELELMGKENNLEVGNKLDILNEALGKAVQELKGLRV